MANQEIQEAKERVRALRRQIRAEQSERAVATMDAAKEAQLAALTEEERSLEAQLAEIRSTQRPGAEEAVVPAEPGEGNVNVTGGPIRADQDPLAQGAVPEDGTAFREVVDARGNLVREPVTDAVTEDSTVALTDPSAPAPEPEAQPNPDDVGTREAEQVPPADDATTARPKRR